MLKHTHWIAVQQLLSEKMSELREVCLLAIPTVFDLMATVLMNIGLLSVTASVYQMMRGAEMLFAAFFSVMFLHRTLNRNHFIGISCCVVGSPPPPPPPHPLLVGGNLQVLTLFHSVFQARVAELFRQAL